MMRKHYTLKSHRQHEFHIHSPWIIRHSSYSTKALETDIAKLQNE